MMKKPVLSPFTWSKIALVTCLIACVGDMILVNVFSRFYPAI